MAVSPSNNGEYPLLRGRKKGVFFLLHMPISSIRNKQINKKKKKRVGDHRCYTGDDLLLPPFHQHGGRKHAAAAAAASCEIKQVINFLVRPPAGALSFFIAVKQKSARKQLPFSCWPPHRPARSTRLMRMFALGFIQSPPP